jgi:hypothetical protein
VSRMNCWAERTYWENDQIRTEKVRRSSVECDDLQINRGSVVSQLSVSHNKSIGEILLHSKWHKLENDQDNPIQKSRSEVIVSLCDEMIRDFSSSSPFRKAKVIYKLRVYFRKIGHILAKRWVL